MPLQSAPLGRLQVEYVPLSSLKPDQKNARRHTALQVSQIALSIATFGFNVPLLVDEDGTIFVGNGRFFAAEKSGLDVVPVIRIKHLSPEQIRAYAIADNRLTERSTWDEDVLAQTLKELVALDLDFNIEATAFSMGEIDLKIQGLDQTNTDEADETPQPTLGPAVSKPGQVWWLNQHAIYCGDSLQASSYDAVMQGKLASAIFTDFPYNKKIFGDATGRGKIKHREFAMASGEMTDREFVSFLATAMNRMARVSARGSIHFLCMDWRQSFALQTAAREVYDELLNICVWAKSNGGMGGLYRSAHEFVFVYKVGGGKHRNNVQLGKHGRNRLNVWSYDGSNGFLRSSEDSDLLAQHPTPKPVRLVADALLDVTARRDIVLDAFLGSGATLIAAERTGRICRAIEIDPIYVDLSIRRWQRLTGEKARLEDGRTFDELAAMPTKPAP